MLRPHTSLYIIYQIMGEKTSRAQPFASRKRLSILKNSNEIDNHFWLRLYRRQTTPHVWWGWPCLFESITVYNHSPKLSSWSWDLQKCSPWSFSVRRNVSRNPSTLLSICLSAFYPISAFRLHLQTGMCWCSTSKFDRLTVVGETLTH